MKKEQRQLDRWARSLAGQSVVDYRLLQFVGAGRIGYVYRAQHKDLDDYEQAVKLTFSLKDGWDTELRKVVKLGLVDGVVHFHALGTGRVTHDGHSKLCQYTVWDYIPPGRNLRDYLQAHARVPTTFLIAVVERILHVLHACEAKGIVRHGDLHSGNILIGESTHERLDDSLHPRAPIYVSDFGYGVTGGDKTPKDDYAGLAGIINDIVRKIEYSTATSTHKQILQALQRNMGKMLRDAGGAERRAPLDLLRLLKDITRAAQTHEAENVARGEPSTSPAPSINGDSPSVGLFQVSEMIGERWEWWKKLFVPSVPARSKILALDIPTVVTGPRGCGKTMLFRRLSERLVVECGDTESGTSSAFVAFYVNANDFADAFSHFPLQPSAADQAHLVCYANVSVLAEVLAVQSARAGKFRDPATHTFLDLVQRWLVAHSDAPLVVGEDRLELYRGLVEEIKWKFPGHASQDLFPGYAEFAQHRWLPRFMQHVRALCPWIDGRAPLLFIDDFSTPRISPSMQRVLNRLFLQRSTEFLAKVATEAWGTFVPEDSSGKTLEDGDDYQLVDMGEEALFLPDAERLAFLDAVFRRRLSLDPRMPSDRAASLNSLLGRLGMSKTEFARQLRSSIRDHAPPDQPRVSGDSQRRGRSRARVYYFGEDVFSDLWSGDTRTMIQLITDVIDQTAEATQRTAAAETMALPVDPGLQDRVFRHRGGEWLNSHTRNEPTDPKGVKSSLATYRSANPGYHLAGEYGDHLKAVVEAFVASANELLLGPMYTVRDNGGQRQVPRMAFRIEIVDEFRLDGLAREIYRDLLRYGLFMRDNRGKSVRGAFVPRLYLRRLLLPYCTLALSKRDSVPLTSETFTDLLLSPDAFKAKVASRRAGASTTQLAMAFAAAEPSSDPLYDDIGPGNHGHDAVDANASTDGEEPS
jgi:hypothetical protein